MKEPYLLKQRKLRINFDFLSISFCPFPMSFFVEKILSNPLHLLINKIVHFVIAKVLITKENSKMNVNYISSTNLSKFFKTNDIDLKCDSLANLEYYYGLYLIRMHAAGKVVHCASIQVMF